MCVLLAVWPRQDDEDGSAARVEWAEALHSCYLASFRAAIDFAGSCERSSSGAGLAIATPVLGSGARGAPFAPAAMVLADAATQQLGRGVDGTMSGFNLRVVVNAASLGSEAAMVETAVHAAASMHAAKTRTAVAREQQPRRWR